MTTVSTVLPACGACAIFTLDAVKFGGHGLASVSRHSDPHDRNQPHVSGRTSRVTVFFFAPEFSRPMVLPLRTLRLCSAVSAFQDFGGFRHKHEVLHLERQPQTARGKPAKSKLRHYLKSWTRDAERV